MSAAKQECGCTLDPALVSPQHSPTAPHHVRLDGTHDHPADPTTAEELASIHASIAEMETIGSQAALRRLPGLKVRAEQLRELMAPVIQLPAS